MKFVILLIVLFPQYFLKGADLWTDLSLISKNENDFKVNIKEIENSSGICLVSRKSKRYAAFSIPKTERVWDFSLEHTIEAEITNKSDRLLTVYLWVVGGNGWDAVPNVFELKPNEMRVFSCDLRESFPDGTPKVNPSEVLDIQVMLKEARIGDEIEIGNLRTEGLREPWVMPKQRLEVPEMVEDKPSVGKRVRFSLDRKVKDDKYISLYLPKNWVKGEKYPVIVEFPGNIHYVKGCYSTGRPEQCVMGYGMTKGEGAIWICMPFLKSAIGPVAENKWGNPDETVNYTIEIVREICKNYGGDEENVIVTGFSRGAIACGFIGLRNEEIAALWKGIHICQHYDGDGWGGATKQGALDRIKNFSGESFFCTDNDHKVLKDIFESSKVKATFVNSGLGAHSCAMFLDDRPSTLKVREWFKELVK